VPGYLFTALSYFNWVCWIAPNNVPLNQMFGYSHGMGMSLITFDWSQIAYIGSPLATPWWAAANVGVGFVVNIFLTLLSPTPPDLASVLLLVPHASAPLHEHMVRPIPADVVDAQFRQIRQEGKSSVTLQEDSSP
jgi:hypothetical protein